MLGRHWPRLMGQRGPLRQEPGLRTAGAVAGRRGSTLALLRSLAKWRYQYRSSHMLQQGCWGWVRASSTASGLRQAGGVPIEVLLL